MKKMKIKDKKLAKAFSERPLPEAEEVLEFEKDLKKTKFKDSQKEDLAKQAKKLKDLEERAKLLAKKELELKNLARELEKKKGSLEKEFSQKEEIESLAKKEASSEELKDTSLASIYQDKSGNEIKVGKVAKKKNLALIIFFKRFIVLAVIATALYGLYNYFEPFSPGPDKKDISLEIIAPEKVQLGKEFEYRVVYQNEKRQKLNNIRLELSLPENFILSSKSEETSGLNSWSLGSLDIAESGEISLKGRLYGPVNSVNLIKARIFYEPANFSSELKEEQSASTYISNLGFLVNLDYLNTALIAQDNELKLSLSAFEENELEELYLEIKASDNFSLIKLKEFERGTELEDEEELFKLEKITESQYLIKNLIKQAEDSYFLPIYFSFKEKINNEEDLSLSLFTKQENGKSFQLWEKTIKLELVNSDFNLNLAINGEKSKPSFNFGEKLEYEIQYINQGELDLKDVSIMAVINSKAIDWPSLDDELNGKILGNSIVWTKGEIPALANISPGQSGTIKFSINSKRLALGDLASESEISSYAQYSLNNSQADVSEDNRSNTIKGAFNSDLSLSEKILYFNEDNLPVGSGPLPPRVGEETSLRVYWTLKNSLHDLKDTKVSLSLPSGVIWAENSNTNVGSLSYDELNHIVTWRLGLLPSSIYRADAEFSIKLLPSESDRDKILVLSPGAIVQALDLVTGANLELKTGTKTSNLEDDDIAALFNDGRVE